MANAKSDLDLARATVRVRDDGRATRRDPQAAQEVTARLAALPHCRPTSASGPPGSAVLPGASVTRWSSRSSPAAMRVSASSGRIRCLDGSRLRVGRPRDAEGTSRCTALRRRLPAVRSATARPGAKAAFDRTDGGRSSPGRDRRRSRRRRLLLLAPLPPGSNCRRQRGCCRRAWRRRWPRPRSPR